MKSVKGFACLALLGAACASQYKYQPTTHATAKLGGQLAAEYQIPLNAPAGDLRVASFGISNVTTKGNPGVPFPAIHVRMEVANNGTQPWKIDTREQMIDFSDGTRTRAAIVKANQGQTDLPEVRIAAGDKRVIDLFYELPANQQTARKLSEFDLVSKVQVGEQTVTERTPFDRLRVEPTSASRFRSYDGSSYYLGPWGGPFWYDPELFPREYIGSDVSVGTPGWSAGNAF